MCSSISSAHMRSDAYPCMYVCNIDMHDTSLSLLEYSEDFKGSSCVHHVSSGIHWNKAFVHLDIRYSYQAYWGLARLKWLIGRLLIHSWRLKIGLTVEYAHFIKKTSRAQKVFVAEVCLVNFRGETVMHSYCSGKVEVVEVNTKESLYFW